MLKLEYINELIIKGAAMNSILLIFAPGFTLFLLLCNHKSQLIIQQLLNKLLCIILSLLSHMLNIYSNKNFST